MLNLKKIYELMEYKGIKNVYQLSKKVKVPYSTLHYMFMGHDMNMSSIAELAKFFGVTIDDLVNKNYDIVILKGNDEIHSELTNIYEATMLYMM